MIDDERYKILSLATTYRPLPMVIEQTRSYQSLILLSLSVIGILIIGGILWYIFVRTSHSCKYDRFGDQSLLFSIQLNLMSS